MFYLGRDKGPAPPGAAQPKKVTARDRLYAALRELGDRYRTAEALTEAGREQIAVGIEKLPDLGKTDPWKGAIKGLGRSGPRRGQPPELGLLPVRRLRGPRSLRHPAGRWGSSTATLPTRSTRRE
jgi:hypothetical protein